MDMIMPAHSRIYEITELTIYFVVMQSSTYKYYV